MVIDMQKWMAQTQVCTEVHIAVGEKKSYATMLGMALSAEDAPLFFKPTIRLNHFRLVIIYVHELVY